jgi:HEAT repeat protein
MDLEEAVDKWRKGCASLDDVVSLAAQLGNKHYLPGIPILMELFDHEDPIVRYNAAMSLGFEFHHRPAVERLLTMLADDPDEDCRHVAAGALGAIFQETKDRRVLLALAKSALNENDVDDYVRSNAYRAILRVNGVSADERYRLLHENNLPVDREKIDQILADVFRDDAGSTPSPDSGKQNE